MLDRIAAIVRGARDREARTLDEVAARSGVPVEVLEALEAGRRGITTTQLDAVAMALSLDPAALLGGRDVPRPQPSLFLRHAAFQDFDARDGAVLDEALEQGRALSGLRTALGDPALALQAGRFAEREAGADRAEAPAQDGYRLAREVRRWLGDAEGPLGDVGCVVEDRFGVAVLVRRLASNRVTAASVRAGVAAAVVLGAGDVERARSPLLTRVHLAHELCHVLFDPSPGGLHIVLDTLADRRVHAAEQRARAFAAELLLPLDGLTRLLGPPAGERTPDAALRLVAAARSHFGTPHEIAANHLCNLRFVDRTLREGLEASHSAFTGAPPATSLPLVDEASRAVARLVERAHREGHLTDGEARSMLGLDRLSPLPWDEAEL